MKRALAVLFLFLATPAHAAQFCQTIPDSVLAQAQQGLDIVNQQGGTSFTLQQYGSQAIKQAMIFLLSTEVRMRNGQEANAEIEALKNAVNQ